jgi:aconitate hydratase
MGVLPLVYKAGQTAASLGLSGAGTFEILLDDTLKPKQDVTVKCVEPDGKTLSFTTTCRIDTPVEIEYYRNGGILHTVLRKMLYGAA